MRSHQIWFTSDTHFFHGRILEKDMSSRQFSTMEEMNETIITNWNSVVDERDEVYHLGDFSFGNLEESLSVLKRLKGKVHLIEGNHERGSVKKKYLNAYSSEFASFNKYLEIKVYDNEDKKRQRVILFHYPILLWNRAHKGSWHLHGHSHGSLRADDTYKRIDVSTDAWNLTPINYDTIRDIMETREFVPVDHHGQ